MFKIRHKKSYNGRPFVVTIDRSTAERGYSIRPLNKDGTLSKVKGTPPLKAFEFVERYGFSPTWPHQIES